VSAGPVQRNRVSTGSVFSSTLLGEAVARLLEGAEGPVADVGCGEAPYRGLLGAGPRVGIDRSVPSEAGAVDAVGDAQAVPLRSGAFRTVLCTEVIEHVPDERRLVAELTRLAGPGGRLVLSSPFVHGLHEEPHDYRRLTSIGLVAVLEEHGWRVDRVVAVGGVGVVTVDSGVRWVDTTVRRVIRRVAGRDSSALRSAARVSARVQRWLATAASARGSVVDVDPSRPSPRLTLGYVVGATAPSAPVAYAPEPRSSGRAGTPPTRDLGSTSETTTAPAAT